MADRFGGAGGGAAKSPIHRMRGHARAQQRLCAAARPGPRGAGRERGRPVAAALYAREQVAAGECAGAQSAGKSRPYRAGNRAQAGQEGKPRAQGRGQARPAADGVHQAGFDLGLDRPRSPHAGARYRQPGPCRRDRLGADRAAARLCPGAARHPDFPPGRDGALAQGTRGAGGLLRGPRMRAQERR